MRNREGRRRCVRTSGAAAVRRSVGAFAAWLAAFAWPVAALAAEDAARSAPWVVRAVTGDTGCAVLDDGERARLHCIGDRIGELDLRLVRIEGETAVFAIDGGTPSPLNLRVAVGDSFDPVAARARWLEALGPRPGWIEGDPVAAPERLP